MQQTEYSPESGKNRAKASSSVQKQDLPTASSQVEMLGRRISNCLIVRTSFLHLPRGEDAAGKLALFPAKILGPMVEAK